MLSDFKDLYLALEANQQAKHNFIIHCIVAERAGSSPGRYLYPGATVFMQMAVDHLAYPMVDAYLEAKREERNRERGNRF